MTYTTIKYGPFKGMKFLNECHSVNQDDNYSKLLGLYEYELCPFINDIITTNYDNIVNIGAGNGYYAAGLAFKCPQSIIYAYEANAQEFEICKKNIELNNLSNCNLSSAYMKDEILNLSLKNKTLIVSDCEGFEKEVFNDKIFSCMSFDALIETHDFFGEPISQILRDKFKLNKYIVYEILSISDYEKVRIYNVTELKYLSELDKFNKLKENRPSVMKWLYCKKIT